MRIVTARRISQAYFLVLFLWLSVVATVGEAWWQIRGWPVSWFLQLDPLVALGTVLATRTLYAGLLWALVTIVLTIVLGRFFCSWVCPFGTLHHALGYLGSRGKTASQKVARNQYRSAQSIKYVLLVVLLGAAAGELILNPAGPFPEQAWPWWVIPAVGVLVLLFPGVRRLAGPKTRFVWWSVFLLGVWVLLMGFFSGHSLIGASLQTGLLDPIPLMHRSIGLVVLPLIDGAAHKLAVAQRSTVGAWFIGAVFLAALLLNLKVPRFYCRFICPLGALFGVLSRYALWRIGGHQGECRECNLCERHCEGACEPAAKIRINECVLCMNCLEGCRKGLMGYRTTPSQRGEMVTPDLSRRGLLISLFSGVAAAPAMRLGATLTSNRSAHLMRPPGALIEEDFLKRCIKCGQCMRVCPTNIIHPATFEAGLEGFWSPVLNFRIGTSGCQYNCVACGHVCPTAAIRAMSVEEKQGINEFSSVGPVRVGTAFVDRGRCLPWAMDRPCIVCQENCPVSPKAIFTRDVYRTIRNGDFLVEAVNGLEVAVMRGGFLSGAVATGDYYVRVMRDDEPGLWKIVENTESVLVLAPGDSGQHLPEKGSSIAIQVLLKQPYIDLRRCTGCGVCEHECPVNGKRAVRVTAENETRDKRHKLLL